MEYLVTMTTHVPAGTSEGAVADVRAREAAHTRLLAAQGHIIRLWRPPLVSGEWRTLGLFAATDGGELEQVLATMPLRVWRSDEVTELTHHPSDPVVSAQRPPVARGGRDRHGVLHHLHRRHPRRHADAGRRRCQGGRGEANARARRARSPDPSLAAARLAGWVARAGPVAEPGCRAYAGDPGIAAYGTLADRGDHAARPAPERPGDLGSKPGAAQARRS